MEQVIVSKENGVISIRMASDYWNMQIPLSKFDAIALAQELLDMAEDNHRGAPDSWFPGD